MILLQCHTLEKKCVNTIRPTLSDFILGQEIPEDNLLYHS